MRRPSRALARLTSCPNPAMPGRRRWWQTVCWPQIAMMILVLVFAFGPMLAAGAAPLAPAGPAQLAALTPTPASPVPAARPAAVDDGALLDLEIVQQSVPTLQAGETITFQVTVTNVSDADVTAATVDLLAQEWTASTRFATARWADEDQYSATLPVESESVGLLIPGASVTLNLTASAEDFRVTGWGQRGVELRVTPSEPAGEPDRERSWVTFWNGEELTPTPLTVISPLTASYPEWQDPAALAARSAAILMQASLPGVALAVDPSVLPLLSEPDRAAAIEALPSLDVWTLPWSDVDALALVADGRPDVVAAATERSEEELEALGVSPAGAVDLDAGGDRRLLPATTGVVTLSSTQIPEWWEGSFTPGARVEIAEPEPAADAEDARGAGPVADEPRDGVVADSHVANALTGVVVVDGDRYQLADATLDAYLVAQSAAFTRERPSVARPLAVVLPRTDDGAHAASLATLGQQPWMAPTPLGELLAMEPVRHPVSVIPAGSALPPAAVTSDVLEDAASARAAVSVATELSEDFGKDVAAEVAALDRVAALAWRANPSGRADSLAELEGRAQDLIAAVSVEPPSTFNLMSDSLNIPVTITNTADVPLDVEILLETPDTRLRQDEPTPVTVPADGHVTSLVPVTAVGSGKLTMQVHLVTASGAPVGEPTPVDVRLLIQWENAMLIGLVAVGAIALVVGIARTAIRNRRTHRAETVDAAAAELDKLMDEEDQ